ncbi:TPA: KxYKxGKxW signal peptide domain-containing protein, partial [Streptococcus suis]|nr:KxYKxGKxW signal peptide domain-containing protein [Streptococcus suis]HEL2374018.1 KxYKxGKxW signal peptide domain-containing protein [Streptococcus suis]
MKKTQKYMSETSRKTRVKMHKAGKHWVRTVMTQIGFIKFKRSASEVDEYAVKSGISDSAKILRGVIAAGTVLGGGLALDETVRAEETTMASEVATDTTLGTADTVIMETTPTVETATSETATTSTDSVTTSVETATSEVAQSDNSVATEEKVDKSLLEQAIASLKDALSKSIPENVDTTTDKYAKYVKALENAKVALTKAEAALSDDTLTQEQVTSLATSSAQSAISLTGRITQLTTIKVVEGSGFRVLASTSVLSNVDIELNVPNTAIEPMGANGGDMYSVIKFTLDDTAKAGDTFKIVLSDTLNTTGNGVVNDAVIPNIVVNGNVVATGTWDYVSRTITYTMTEYVTNNDNISGQIELSVFVDQRTVQNEGYQTFTVTVDGETVSKSQNVAYSDPASNGGMYSIRSFFTNIDRKAGTYEQVVYLNENGMNTNLRYNDSLTVRTDTSSVTYTPENSQVIVYSVPVGGFIDSMEGDFSKYTDVTNKTTITYAADGSSIKVQMNGYTTSPLLVLIKSSVDIDATDKIHVTSIYANSSNTTGAIWTTENSIFANYAIAEGESRISTSESISESESLSNSESASKSESLSNSESASKSESLSNSESSSKSKSLSNSESASKSESLSNSESSSKSESLSNSESASKSESLSNSESSSKSESLSNSESASKSESLSNSESSSKSESLSNSESASKSESLSNSESVSSSESTSNSISNSLSESVRESVSESISESVRESVVESVSESISESVSESISESVSESISESVSESISESISESVSESISESVSESISESTSESISESVSESISESVSESISESVSESISESVSESISESVSESISESTSESISESVSESISESVSESISESVSES